MILGGHIFYQCLLFRHFQWLAAVGLATTGVFADEVTDVVKARTLALYALARQLPAQNSSANPDILDDKSTVLALTAPFEKCEYEPEHLASMDAIEKILEDSMTKPDPKHYVQGELSKIDMSPEDRGRILGIFTHNPLDRLVKTNFATQMALGHMKQMNCRKYLRSLFDDEGATQESALAIIERGMVIYEVNLRAKDPCLPNSLEASYFRCISTRMKAQNLPPDQFAKLAAASFGCKLDENLRKCTHDYFIEKHALTDFDCSRVRSPATLPHLQQCLPMSSRPSLP